MHEKVRDLRLTPLKALELLRIVERAMYGDERHKLAALDDVSHALSNYVRYGLSRRKK
jgi:hypothetical protein